MEKIEFGEYETIDEIGSGGCGQVYLVKKKDDNKNKPCKAYILKTLKENAKNTDIRDLKNEIDRLEYLKEQPPSPYIPFLYGFDKDYFQIVDKKKIAKPYYVIDYFSKGNLFYYTKIHNFSEKHAKVIFKKILEAVKFCHDKNICHLDIKPENIVFDFTFGLSLIDFGFANKIKDEKKTKLYYTHRLGTPPFECPEMWEKKKYTGDKADIFSLGVVLIILVSGSYGFLLAKETDDYYKYIIKDTKEAYEKYWEEVIAQINVNLSDNFKKLYIKMVAHDPGKRPPIDEILTDKWFEEINILNEQEYKNLENEIKSELKEIYKKLIVLNREIELSDKIIKAEYNTRTLDDEDKLFRNPNLQAKKIPIDRMKINHYIIINGYLDEKDFMNSLIYSIKHCKKYEDSSSIIASPENLKFKVIFDADERYEKECVIYIELFKYDIENETKYLLEFIRRGGVIPQYYKNFLIIKDIIEKMFEEKNDGNKKNQENQENKNNLNENILKI